MGAGCIGLVSMMALKARGVSEVYVVDLMDKRLEKAMELGATGVINGGKEDVVAKIKELTGGLGADLIIETAGSQPTTVQAIHAAKKGSTIVLVGYSKSGEMTLPMSLALDKELTFKTVFRYRHIYPLAIDAVAKGKVNLKGIVTDIFTLDQAQEAMDHSNPRQSRYRKSSDQDRGINGNKMERKWKSGRRPLQKVYVPISIFYACSTLWISVCQFFQAIFSISSWLNPAFRMASMSAGTWEASSSPMV